jgi:N-acetylmuramoyl-L-alanine amidase
LGFPKSGKACSVTKNKQSSLVIRFLCILIVAIFHVFMSNVTSAHDAAVDPDRSIAQDRWRGLEVVIALSHSAPYRVFTLDAPRRLVVDFGDVDWSGVRPDRFTDATAIEAAHFGTFQPGWSRLVLELSRPLDLRNAEMRVDEVSGAADVILRLDPTDPVAFTAQAGEPPSDFWRLDQMQANLSTLPRQTGDRPLRVVIDPGHGGVDPGAEREGVREADLMLQTGQELYSVLIDAGVDAIMTRQTDVFVPLETRLTIARNFRADLFISLHADALVKDEAQGATIYTLSKDSSDTATAKLADRHNRTDLIAGLDLTGQGDDVMDLLMELAQRETSPRSDAMAQALLTQLERRNVRINSRPIRSGGFWVLRAPDIPSILLEVGFLSNSDDLAELLDTEKRLAIVLAVRDAIKEWAITDAAQADLLRK